MLVVSTTVVATWYAHHVGLPGATSHLSNKTADCALDSAAIS